MSILCKPYLSVLIFLSGTYRSLFQYAQILRLPRRTDFRKRRYLGK